MRLIPGALLALLYLFTSNGHPNGLLILAIIVISVGAYFELKHAEAQFNSCVIGTLSPEQQEIIGSGSFDVDANGKISNMHVDGITVDDEGNITDASPEAMMILFEILDLVRPPHEDKP
jgi:hypothetical protein